MSLVHLPLTGKELSGVMRSPLLQEILSSKKSPQPPQSGREMECAAASVQECQEASAGHQSIHDGVAEVWVVVLPLHLPARPREANVWWQLPTLTTNP